VAALHLEKMNISDFIGGFFLLLGIAILLRFLGNKLIPIIMPQKRLQTIGVGWLGGLVGSLLDGAMWQFGPQVVGVNVVAAVIGSALLILFLGLLPFIKIFLGKI